LDVDTDRAAELNRAWWDSVRRQRDAGLIPKQVDVAADLRAGRGGPSPDERRLAGDVRGKRLLDLGCGAGRELLEWALAGADVTGVDNSPAQLAAARRAADALGVRGRLVLADILALPDDLLQGRFDVVFSSHATAWVGDLDRWFDAVRRALVPGGVFLLRGGHALSGFLTGRRDGDPGRASYFDEGPFVRRPGRSPDWNPLGEEHTFVEWSRGLGTVVTAVARAGLRVTDLVEASESGAPYPDFFVLRATKT
jgi:SAM-dependent methyltransferase